MFNNNKGAVALTAVAMLLSIDVGAAPVSTLQAYAPNEVLVVPRATVSAQAVDAMGMQVAGEYRGSTHFLRLKLGKGQTVEQALGTLSAQPWVAHAQPNYIHKASAVPDDTRFAEYWGLRNTGQLVNGISGTAGVDISAVEAWDDTTDCSAITVAVVDTGVDYNHPDLSANIWTNPGEIPGNGLDDDGNGQADDVRGWDFVSGDNNPNDLDLHGTHVAGTIGAVGDNATGGTGVCWGVQLMPVRVLDGNGSGLVADIIAGIDYAVASGADIINMSLGGGGAPGDLMDLAIGNAHAAGVLVVAAAGNGGADGIGDDNDVIPTYPASYDQPNIIAVAATDQNDNLASFSNYGANSVDIAAPGVNILSAEPAAPEAVSGLAWNFDTGTMEGWSGETIDTTTGNPVTNTVGVTTAQSYSPSYSLTDTPVGTYANDREYRASSPVLDLSGLQDVTLSYQMNLNTESCCDPLMIDVWDGAAWTPVGGWAGNTGGFVAVESDISALDGFSSAQVRFRLVSDYSITYDGFYVDDVAVTIPGTTYSGNEYQYLDGTSMATPHVAGLAALVWAADPGQTHLEVRDKILNNGDTVAGLAGTSVTGMRINAQMSLPLRPVTGLNASVASATRVDLAWTDSSVSETGYTVERKVGTGSYSTLAPLATNANAYNDTSAPAASNLTYRITGTARDGRTTSSTVTATTPPVSPTGLAAVSTDVTGQVSVSWTAASGATSYNLYWSTSPGVTPATGTQIAGVTSPYTHSGLTNGTTYYYVVTALKDSAESAASAETSATPTGSGTTGGGGGGSSDPALLMLLMASGYYLRRRRRA